MGVLLFITVLLTFFAGIVVGVAITIFSEGQAPHVVEMEDSYQPFE